MKKSVFILGAVLLGVLACENVAGPIARPENLGYQLEPSGDPLFPQGVLLFWGCCETALLCVRRLMRFQVVTHLVDRICEYVLFLFPRIYRRLGVGRQLDDLDGCLVRV